MSQKSRLRSALRVAGLLIGLGVGSSAQAQTTVPVVQSMAASADAVGKGPAKRERKGAAKKDELASATGAAVKPRTRRNGVTVVYDNLKKSWHAPASASAQADYNAALLPPLVFHVVHKELDPPVVLVPLNDQGEFGADQMVIARLAFGGTEKRPDVQVHPRTLSLVYRAMRHFGAPFVHLISGIRPDRGGSRHTHGHAADIVLPGVSDETLATYFRGQGFVGVGVYTRAGFVHVDSREESFFWLDRSLPGKKGGRIMPIMKEEAAAMDQAALARGEHPASDPPRLARALDVRLRKIVKKNRAKREAVKAATATPSPAATPGD